MRNRELTIDDQRILKHCAQRLGEFLHQMREQGGWTQEAVSLHAQLDNKTFRRIERAESSPTLETLLLIARVLGLTPSELFHGIADALEGIPATIIKTCVARMTVEDGLFEIEVWRNSGG